MPIYRYAGNPALQMHKSEQGISIDTPIEISEESISSKNCSEKVIYKGPRWTKNSMASLD